MEATAATDVTGLGLLGHAANTARCSAATPESEPDLVPVFPAAMDHALLHRPGGLKANRRHYEPLVAFNAEPADALMALLVDPWTSGGHLVALPDAAVPVYFAPVSGSCAVGRVIPGAPYRLGSFGEADE